MGLSYLEQKNLCDCIHSLDAHLQSADSPDTHSLTENFNINYPCRYFLKADKSASNWCF